MASSYIQVLSRNLSAALRKGDLEEAEALMERLREEDPMSLSTRGLELELTLKKGSLGPARSLCETLLSSHPDSSRIQFLAGDLNYKEKRYAIAVKHYRESFQLFNHWRSKYWLGKALTQAGQLDEAQSILEELVTKYTYIQTDLAWLYERKGDLEKALETYENVAERDPENKWVLQQMERIKGLLLDPEELVEELETLEDLGEEIPEHLLSDFVANLFKTGQAQKARDLVSEKLNGMNHRMALKVGWSCYHAQAYDLAFDLWIIALPHNLKAFKFINSIQAAARKAGRVDTLKELFEQYGSKEPSLYGRLRRL